MVPKNLVEYAQAHERTWGKDSYPERPTLEDILKSPVVAFWLDSSIAGGRQHIITLHNDLKPIQAYFSTLARRLHIGFPNRRLIILFAKGQEIRVTGAKAAFEVAKSSTITE